MRPYWAASISALVLNRFRPTCARYEKRALSVESNAKDVIHGLDSESERIVFRIGVRKGLNPVSTNRISDKCVEISNHDAD